jgi:hypothetical protein
MGGRGVGEKRPQVSVDACLNFQDDLGLYSEDGAWDSHSRQESRGEFVNEFSSLANIIGLKLL